MSKIDACKICRNPAALVVTQPNEAMHNGWASISCSCGQEVKILPNQMRRPQFREGQTGWDVIFSQLEYAKHECISRWNCLNS